MRLLHNLPTALIAEITWTIIPILILIAIAVPATKTLILMEQTGDAEITLEGHRLPVEMEI